MVPWLQAAQGHTTILHLDPPKATDTVDWLVVAVILHQFRGVFKYCIWGPLTSTVYKSIHKVACHGTFNTQHNSVDLFVCGATGGSYRARAANMHFIGLVK